MKYINLREGSNNIGVVAVTAHFNDRLVSAIEEHFDAIVINIPTLNPFDYINTEPKDIEVKLDIDGEQSTQVIELSETWLY